MTSHQALTTNMDCHRNVAAPAEDPAEFPPPKQQRKSFLGGILSTKRASSSVPLHEKPRSSLLGRSSSVSNKIEPIAVPELASAGGAAEAQQRPHATSLSTVELGEPAVPPLTATPSTAMPNAPEAGSRRVSFASQDAQLKVETDQTVLVKSYSGMNSSDPDDAWWRTPSMMHKPNHNYGQRKRELYLLGLATIVGFVVLITCAASVASSYSGQAGSLPGAATGGVGSGSQLVLIQTVTVEATLESFDQSAYVAHLVSALPDVSSSVSQMSTGLNLPPAAHRFPHRFPYRFPHRPPHRIHPPHPPTASPRATVRWSSSTWRRGACLSSPPSAPQRRSSTTRRLCSAASQPRG